MSHWEAHRGVRTGNDLTLGERSADVLKRSFGTWSALGLVAVVIAVYMVAQAVMGRGAFDPYPYILLNLALSCLAAVQGIVLQISANRGDRISAEVALHTQSNTDDLISINRQQTAILNELREIRAAVGGESTGA